jgi:hypothetical protein
MSEVDLTDKAALRAGLRELDARELGVVLGLTLIALDDNGDSALSVLLRELADEVEEIEREVGGQ